MHLKEKIEAVSLRKSGKSHSEIRSTMPKISKGTISRWLSSVQLTESQKKKIEAQSHRGRLRSNITNRRKKTERLKAYFHEAKKRFAAYHRDAFFVAGLILYWAEGTKTTESVHFMNSDSRLITLMLSWVKKYLEVSPQKTRARLYIHEIYAHERHERFWKKNIAIPRKNFLRTIYKPTPHTVKKNPNYRGCIRIDAGGVKEFYMIKFWQDLLAKKYRLLPL